MSSYFYNKNINIINSILMHEEVNPDKESTLKYMKEGFFSKKPKISDDDKINIIKGVCKEAYEKYKGKDRSMYESPKVVKHDSPYVRMLYVSIAPQADMYMGGALDRILSQYANDIKSAISKEDFRTSVDTTQEYIIIGY